MIIRKASFGPDYKNAMHFTVGNTLNDGRLIVHEILQTEDMSIDIWVKRETEIIKWKTFNYSFPVSLEYNIDFI